MTAEQALAEAWINSRPVEHHSQLCPVWTERRQDTHQPCDCFVWAAAPAIAKNVLAHLPEGWSLTATPPDSDAQIAVLREALTDVLEYMARDYPSDSIDFSDAWRVLADTKAAAKAYHDEVAAQAIRDYMDNERDEIVKPWRTLVRGLIVAPHLAITATGRDCNCVLHEDARALLSNTESAPPESEAGK